MSLSDIFNVKDLRILMVVSGVDVTDSVKNDSTSLEDIDCIENATKIYTENKNDLIPADHIRMNKGKKDKKIIEKRLVN